MTANLTPPADAPLPWSVKDDGFDETTILDANGRTVIELLALRADAVPCLVACANAAQGLVAERDTALARVAALEAETTALRDALIDTIALALDVRDLRSKLSAVRKVANDTSRPFDWFNVQAIIDAPLETP